MAQGGRADKMDPPAQTEVSMLLTADNSDAFFSGNTKPVKAILFTKKMETPSLWLRVAEAHQACCDFGEVRLAENALMERFGLSAEVLPKILAVRMGPDGEQQTIVYEGPNDFEKIGQFVSDAADGGAELVALKRQVDELTRETRGLRVEVAQEREATTAARAEAARMKLSQVGQVEAVRKGLEVDLQQARASELAVKERLEAQVSELIARLKAQQETETALLQELDVLKSLRSEGGCTALKLEHVSALHSFLDSTSHPLKAVLLTKKEEIPELWQNLSAAHASTCAFGMVRHVHDPLMNAIKGFGVNTDVLPRIVVWTNRAVPPLVYEGMLHIDSIAAFITDALAGGKACVELRSQLQAAQAEGDAIRRQLADALAAAAVQRDQAELARREQVATLDAAINTERETVKSLQAQLKAACAGAGSELQRVRADAEAQVQAAERMAAELSAELVREREATQDKIAQAVSRKEALLTADLERRAQQREVARELEAAHLKVDAVKLAQAASDAEVLERELKLTERAARTCERAVLKAASAVHVSLVRSARENERTHAALREFIDDIAPCQVDGPLMDGRLLREAMAGEDARGVVEKAEKKMSETMSTISNQYKLLKQRLKMPDDSSDDVVGAGVGGGSENGGVASAGLVSGQMRRALSFMRRNGSEGKGGGGSDSDSRRSEEKRGGGVSRSEEGGGAWREGRGMGAEGAAGEMNAATLQRLKKLQARDLVSLRGHTDVTIGQLTREVLKTKEKHVFQWRDLKLRLLYDGAVRDRLIDDETGHLVYAYPREIEEARLRRKSQGAKEGLDREEGVRSRSVDACAPGSHVDEGDAAGGGAAGKRNRKASDHGLNADAFQEEGGVCEGVRVGNTGDAARGSHILDASEGALPAKVVKLLGANASNQAASRQIDAGRWLEGMEGRDSRDLGGVGCHRETERARMPALVGGKLLLAAASARGNEAGGGRRGPVEAEGDGREGAKKRIPGRVIVRGLMACVCVCVCVLL